MAIFNMLWDWTKLIAGLVGRFLGGMLIFYLFWGVLLGVFGVCFLLYKLAESYPLLGVPLIVAAGLFCFWCAYFQKGATRPHQTVLRGPFVVTSDDHRFFGCVQRGSGDAQPKSEEQSVATSTDPDAPQ